MTTSSLVPCRSFPCSLGGLRHTLTTEARRTPHKRKGEVSVGMYKYSYVQSLDKIDCEAQGPETAYTQRKNSVRVWALLLAENQAKTVES